MKILFFGDIVGKSGRAAVREFLPKLRKQHSPDLVIANAENAAHGKGVTVHTVASLLDSGVDFLTSGNHVFDKPEAAEVFDKFDGQIIRPANFGPDLPGRGWATVKAGKSDVLIVNLNGQVFMEAQFDFGEIRNPFLELDAILSEHGDTPIRIVDMHAEATSEKRGMGFYADGRASLVVGTHTHVATADFQVLPAGTGYQTDLGMAGSRDSVIGVKKEGVLTRFKEGEKTSGARLEVDENPPFEVGFCVAEIDSETGKCENIKGYLEFLA